MRPPLRIAILECDVVIDPVKARYEGYTAVFTDLFRKSANALGQPERLDPETGLDISRWHVVDNDEYPSLDEVDAIVMTGSKHNSFEDRPWINRLVEFTKKALAHDRVKVLGICFGHQILGRALGVKVGRSDLGWEIAVSEVDLTEEGKKLFGKGKLRIQQMHQDIVFDYPSDVIPLGSSPLCAVQGMYRPGKFMSVQGHPEFTDFIVTEVVKMRTQTGLFKGEQSADALRRATNEHDGIAIGKVFLNFLLDGKA